MLGDLESTAFIDFEHPDVAAFVARVTDGTDGEAERAARLFAAVRDEVRYDPSRLPTEPAA